MKQLEKGTFSYYKEKRKRQTIWTIIYLAIPLALFFGGWIATGTQKNLLTFVAILGTLPACKSAVEMIMYYLYKGCDDTLYGELDSDVCKLSHNYSMVFTTPEYGTYEVPSIVIRNNSICGLGRCTKSFDKNGFAKLEEHITAIMRQNGFKVVVKIFDKKENYQQRVVQMSQMEEENAKLDEAQRKLLCDISL